MDGKGELLIIFPSFSFSRFSLYCNNRADDFMIRIETESMIRIETERLILCTDLDDMHRLWADESTMY